MKRIYRETQYIAKYKNPSHGEAFCCARDFIMRKFINIALADGIKRVKITFFRHKLVKGAAFLNAAVFHDQNAVIETGA